MAPGESGGSGGRGAVGRVQEAFDRAAATYDAARRQLVPDLDAFYGTVPRLLPWAAGEPIEVIDLGAGTGLLTAIVARAFPQARFTLIDVAEQMLDVARARFAGEPSRFRFVAGDYATMPVPAGIHAVISGLSIHHLDDPAKRALFAAIRGALRPGGVFVNAEQVRGESDAEERANDAWWLTRARAAGADEPTLAAAALRMREDRTAPLAAQLGWMAEAGFRDVRCAYENRRFAVLCGAR